MQLRALRSLCRTSPAASNHPAACPCPTSRRRERAPEWADSDAGMRPRMTAADIEAERLRMQEQWKKGGGNARSAADVRLGAQCAGQRGCESDGAGIHVSSCLASSPAAGLTCGAALWPCCTSMVADLSRNSHSACAAVVHGGNHDR